MRTHMTQISPVRALLPGKAMSQPDDGTQFRGQKGGISDSSTLFPAPGRPSCRLFRLAKLDFAKSLAVHWTTRNPLDHKDSNDRLRPTRPPRKQAFATAVAVQRLFSRDGPPALSLPTAFLSGRDGPNLVGHCQGSFEEEETPPSSEDDLPGEVCH